jgi:hypothetical protein
VRHDEARVDEVARTRRRMFFEPATNLDTARVVFGRKVDVQGSSLAFGRPAVLN